MMLSLVHCCSWSAAQRLFVFVLHIAKREVTIRTCIALWVNILLSAHTHLHKNREIC